MADVILCVNCKHYSHNPQAAYVRKYRPSEEHMTPEHECRARIDLVTGQRLVLDASLERSAVGKCGVAGTNYVPYQEEISL